MMKKLYLKLRSDGINSLGCDIVWDNPNFQFFGFRNLGVFDDVACELQDNEQGRLLVSALNNGTLEIIGEQEFLEIEFKWAAQEFEVMVPIGAENVIAQDADDNDVEVTVFPADYTPNPNQLVFIWR